MSQTTVGWLLLGAAVLTFVFGFLSRTVVGRKRDSKAVRGLVHKFRRTGVARVLFGRFEDDVLDDDELDSMILMPTIVIGCGLCLTAIFVLGYAFLNSPLLPGRPPHGSTRATQNRALAAARRCPAD